MELAGKLLLAVVFASILAGCADGTMPVAAGMCADLTSTLVTRDDSGRERSSFAAGETIHFEMQIANVGEEPIVLHNADRCPQVEFTVENASGQDIWGSADGIVCAAVVTEITYAAAQSQTFPAEWRQVQRDGASAAPGTYTAFATERTECGLFLSKSVAFTIQLSTPKHLP